MNPLPVMRPRYPSLFFSRKEKLKIQSAIQAVEKETSAEIRIHLEPGQKNRDISEQAREAFERIGMTATRERNGILIFLCPETRRFAVLGDQGIDGKVPSKFWEEISLCMEAYFRQDRFADGIAEALEKIGTQVKKYFPRRPSDRNELSDQISFS